MRRQTSLQSDTLKMNMPFSWLRLRELQVLSPVREIGLEQRLPGSEDAALRALFVHPGPPPRSWRKRSRGRIRARRPSKVKTASPNGTCLTAAGLHVETGLDAMLDLQEPEQIHQGQLIQIRGRSHRCRRPCGFLGSNRMPFSRERHPGLLAGEQEVVPSIESRSPIISARPNRSQASSRLKYCSVGLSRSHCSSMAGSRTRRALVPAPSTRQRPDARSSRFSPCR